MANKIFSVRVPEHISREKFAEKAKALGISESELIIKTLEAGLEFDIELSKYLMAFGKNLHAPGWMVAQNMLIKELADESARDEICGKNETLLVEFVRVSEGQNVRLLTGPELHGRLKAQYMKKYERKMVMEILDRENAGEILDEQENELLFKHKLGKAYLESPEYKEKIQRIKSTVVRKRPTIASVEAEWTAGDTIGNPAEKED